MNLSEVESEDESSDSEEQGQTELPAEDSKYQIKVSEVDSEGSDDEADEADRRNLQEGIEMSLQSYEEESEAVNEKGLMRQSEE